MNFIRKLLARFSPMKTSSELSQLEAANQTQVSALSQLKKSLEDSPQPQSLKFRMESEWPKDLVSVGQIRPPKELMEAVNTFIANRSAPPPIPTTSTDPFTSDPYKGKADTTLEVIGMVAPICQPVSYGMTPQDAKKLETLSKELVKRLIESRDQFLKEQEGKSFQDRSYIVLDAAAALAADWACGQEAAHSSQMDIPSSIGTSVELLQHNFMQKQAEYHARFGQFIH